MQGRRLRPSRAGGYPGVNRVFFPLEVDLIVSMEFNDVMIAATPAAHLRRRGGAGEGEPDPGGWAENEGLATLWVGSFDPALLRDILPGAEGYELVAMIV